MDPTAQVALITAGGAILVALIGLLPRYLDRKTAVRSKTRVEVSEDTFAWSERLMDRMEARAERAEARADQAEARVRALEAELHQRTGP